MERWWGATIPPVTTVSHNACGHSRKCRPLFARVGHVGVGVGVDVLLLQTLLLSSH